jgi:hypothetical protein
MRHAHWFLAFFGLVGIACGSNSGSDGGAAAASSEDGLRGSRAPSCTSTDDCSQAFDDGKWKIAASKLDECVANHDQPAYCMACESHRCAFHPGFSAQPTSCRGTHCSQGEHCEMQPVDGAGDLGPVCVADASGGSDCEAEEGGTCEVSEAACTRAGGTVSGNNCAGAASGGTVCCDH